MISMNATVPPYAAGTDLDRLIALLTFVSDHKAVGARIAELTQARIDAYDVIKSADEVKAEIQQHRDALKAEQKAHAEKLAAERATFENMCHDRDREINERRDETEKLRRDAKAARDEAVKISADLQARLDRVKAAAA
jgi:hypothetical protein